MTDTDCVAVADSNSAGERKSELQALNEVVLALQPLPPEIRERVIEAAAALLRIPLNVGTSLRFAPRGEPRVQTHDVPPGSFSEDRTISCKDFLMRKQPRTEVERVACLAYYLTHYQDNPYFKTIDISKANTEAAQPKFGNTAQAVENAAKMHYLVPASKGNKQLSAPGELFVQALPDREAAKAVMANARPRRKKRPGLQTLNSDKTGADE